MFFLQATAVSSIVYTSVRWIYRRRSRRLIYWLAMSPEQPADLWTGEPLAPEDILDHADVNYRLALTSLALGVVGFVFPAANYLGVPITLFTTMPMLDRALDVTLREQRLNRDVLGSLSIYLAVGTQSYFLASFLQWLYTLNERLAVQLVLQLNNGIPPQSSVSLTEIWIALRREWFQREMWAGGDVIQLDASHVQTVPPESDTRPD